MDFERLLAKYIEHVSNREGADFIPPTRERAEDRGWIFDPEPFTEEEVEELTRLSEMTL